MKKGNARHCCPTKPPTQMNIIFPSVSMPRLCFFSSFPVELMPSYVLGPGEPCRIESRNLAGDHSDKVRELEQAWARHAEAFRALATADGKGALSAKTPAD